MPCRKLVVPSSGSTIQVWVLSVPSLAAAFLAEEAVARPRLQQFGAQDFLGAMVGGGDEIRRTFERDLQVLDLAEVALEAARRLARGGDHDVEQGGLGGHEILQARRARSGARTGSRCAGREANCAADTDAHESREMSTQAARLRRARARAARHSRRPRARLSLIVCM